MFLSDRPILYSIHGRSSRDRDIWALPALANGLLPAVGLCLRIQCQAGSWVSGTLGQHRASGDHVLHRRRGR